ncbi:MAG: zinc dependent phospholipase C family protein [Brevinematia bacterium]
MPKEIVHWSIAEIVRQKLKDGFLKNEINNFYSEYIIGSIAFDIPYYDFSKKMGELGSSLHGKNTKFANTNYEQIANHYKNPPEGLFSFIAGTICHALTDINFHPVVFYYTNDEIDAHRKFETELDLFYLDKVNLPTYSLATLVKTVKSKEFYNFLSLFIFGRIGEKRKLKTNMLKYSLFQYLIRKKWFSNLLKLFRLNGILTLCYGDFKHKDYDFFKSPLTYRLKNEIKTIKLPEIEEKTVSDILTILNEIEKTKDFSKIKFIPLSGEKTE